MAALDEATIASKLDTLDVSDGAATTADAPEPPFAIKYDPRDVAKLAAHEKVEDYPPRALPTGEVALAPQFHLVGAHCGRGFLACDCETTREIPVGTDYHFSGLPAPGSTRSSLLRRWASCVKMSPTMGAFAADAWFDEHGARTIQALETRGDVLARMVDDFCADLDEDPNLPILCQLGGIPEGFPAHEAVDVVAGEARAARAAFVAGDWNCVEARAEIFKMTSMCIRALLREVDERTRLVEKSAESTSLRPGVLEVSSGRPAVDFSGRCQVTKLGATLLHASFQTSDPDAYPADDAPLDHLFAGLDVLVNALNTGFSKRGWRFAAELDRAPAGDGGDAPARVRLPAPEARLAALGNDMD